MATWVFHQTPGGNLAISELVDIGITIGSITFGGCLTVLILAIGLPSESRVRRWARTDLNGGKSNHYTELIFSLTWACITQLVLIVIALINVLLGGDLEVAPHNAFLTHNIMLCVSLSWFFYAIWELITVISTVVQLANVIVYESRRGKDES
jgi:phosphatidylglycerophosphate synthase